MAMWRDPLDELIADLERVVPPPPVVPMSDLPSMTDYCYFGRSIFSRDPAERLHLADDPHVKRVQAYHDRMARAWNRSVAGEGPDGPPIEPSES